MSNVIRLAAVNERPLHNACTDCRHFHPDIESFGKTGWKLLWWGPGKKPSASAMRFAVCSAQGGQFAVWVRKHACEGKLWDPISPPKKDSAGK